VDFLTDIVNQVREALIPSSPPENLKNAFIGLGREWQERVLEEIEKYSKSPISYKDALKAATGIAFVGLGVTSLALAVGMAADAVHPVKEFGARDAAKLMLTYLGVDRTISPLVSVPYEIGVLRPLRQYFESVYQTNIPGMSDLIRFVVREVITPEEFYEVGKLMGYSEKWTRAYWDAHWRLPAPDLLRGAWLRGIISLEEYEKFLVWHDYSPSPRPGISKSDLAIFREMQYDLPGKIDVRWMFRWGLIDVKDVSDLLKKAGLHPEWADKVAQAYTKQQFDADIERVRSVLVRLFERGHITEEELTSRLRELGFPDDFVKLMVEEARYRKKLVELDSKHEVKVDVLKDEKRMLRSVLTSLLIADKISRETFISEMKNIGLTDEEIEATLKYVDYKKKLTEKETKERELTKTELQKAWEMGYITDEDLVNRLKELGLTDADSRLLADIMKANALSSEISLIRTELIESYVKGFIDEETLRSDLLAIGTPEPLVDYYVAKAKIKAEREDKEDWIKILVTAFEKGKIDVTTLRAKLAELGLQSWKIDTIVAYEEAKMKYAS